MQGQGAALSRIIGTKDRGFNPKSKIQDPKDLGKSTRILRSTI
jgi:hypothetical protein